MYVYVYGLRYVDVYVRTYVCIYRNMCIYIYVERERGGDVYIYRYVCIYIYIHIYIYTHYINVLHM